MDRVDAHVCPQELSLAPGRGCRAGRCRGALGGQVSRGCSALQVDRVSYLLQEIYGIENKNNQETKVRARGPAGGPGWRAPCAPLAAWGW